MNIHIATRESPLALWQAEHVKSELLKHDPELTITLVGITTKADKFLDTRLQKIGGKGLFVKELEEALLSNRCDIAVHSMKDVPYQLPPELVVNTYLARHDPGDCLVTTTGKGLDSLAKGAVVGTSSLRRECQLRALRPDLVIKPIRGNVNTRLRKLDEGQFDALIMATAGLERIEFHDKIHYRFSIEEMVPAVGQGIIGIESRQDDHQLHELLQVLNNAQSERCVQAERRLNECLEGNCHLPVAAYATENNSKMTLKAAVGSINTGKILKYEITGSIENPATLGEQAAQALIEQGAAAMIEEARARE